MARGAWIAAGLAFAAGMAAGAACAQEPRQFSGAASYYSKDYKGNVASGAPYDGRKLTAAHRTLPFGTRLTVTDPKTHRRVIVTVNDRGPFTKGRVLDLSYAAAEALQMTERGVIEVTAAIH
jgi:rare lipoprotein A